MRFSILSLIFAGQATAAPALSFPFNSQLPPVAQWGQSYTYELSPDTYRSSNGDISYSSENLPSWLSLNGRTLSGTPSGGQGDTTVTFELIASDSTGQQSSECTLQITDSSLPTYSPGDLEEVLKASGPVASANSAVLVPNQPFEIKFPSSFFSNEGNVIGHYAVTGEHSPLPIWLNFDGGSGTFSGTAPPVNSEIAQAQQFSIIYIVSTFNGFESAGAEFNLLLGANVLSMNISTDIVNATAGHEFTYSVPLNEISFNGSPLTSANLSNAKANIPEDAQSWLSWDTDSFKLTGNPPESAAGTEYTVGIVITDKFNDAVSWDVQIIVTSANNITVFSESSLPPANATRGKWFQYDLSSYILNKDIELSLSSNANWLSINNDNLTISGMVPSTFDKASLNITAVPKSSTNQKKRADSASSAALSSSQEKASSSLTAKLELYGVGPMISSSSSISSSMSSTRSSSSRSTSISSSSVISSTRSRSSSASSTSARSSSIRSSSVRSTPVRSSSGVAGATSSGISASGTTTSTSTSGVTPLNSQVKKGNNNAVAIGCGVGIPVGLLAIASVFLLLFCCRKRRRRENSSGNGGVGATEKAVGGDGAIGADDSNISAPRPSSNGPFMAPVFRANSHSSDEYMDAVEYPGELPGSDENTVYDTPEKQKKLDDSPDSFSSTNNWDSPRHASTMNFVNMDVGSAYRTRSNQLSDQDTIASLTEPAPPTGPNGTLAHHAPPHSEYDDVVGDIPRESWRHTNTGERRWQDARLSQNSLASITPTEPPTVLLAQGDFAENMRQSQALHQRLTAEQGSSNHNDLTDQVNPTDAAVTPAMKREYSSGVLHRVGSHSSSMYSGSYRNSNAISERIGEHYRSGSSTESNNSHDLSDESVAANFRPYRDERGELHWREEVSNDSGETKLNNVGLDRKPSAAKTPKGDHGEFFFV